MKKMIEYCTNVLNTLNRMRENQYNNYLLVKIEELNQIIQKIKKNHPNLPDYNVVPDLQNIKKTRKILDGDGNTSYIFILNIYMILENLLFDSLCEEYESFKNTLGFLELVLKQ